MTSDLIVQLTGYDETDRPGAGPARKVTVQIEGDGNHPRQYLFIKLPVPNPDDPGNQVERTVSVEWTNKGWRLVCASDPFDAEVAVNLNDDDTIEVVTAPSELVPEITLRHGKTV